MVDTLVDVQSLAKGVFLLLLLTAAPSLYFDFSVCRISNSYKCSAVEPTSFSPVQSRKSVGAEIRWKMLDWRLSGRKEVGENIKRYILILPQYRILGFLKSL